jgi:hypothetical protein
MTKREVYELEPGQVLLVKFEDESHLMKGILLEKVFRQKSFLNTRVFLEDNTMQRVNQNQIQSVYGKINWT